MLSVNQLSQFVEFLPDIMEINIKNQEALLDGNSIGMLTAKVNSFISIFMKDQPDSVKEEFRQTWKKEFIEISDSRYDLSLKILLSDQVMNMLSTTIGENYNNAETAEIMQEQVIKPIKDSHDALIKMRELVLESIDKAEL